MVPMLEGTPNEELVVVKSRHITAYYLLYSFQDRGDTLTILQHVYCILVEFLKS